MADRKVRILGVGKYLPNRIIKSSEIDKKIFKPEGWCEKKSGVNTRHYIQNETASQMGAYAADMALKDAGLTKIDIDCIICASATMEQPIPCTAALIHKEMGFTDYDIPAYDINSTCLSFVTALDSISYMIDAGRYDKVLLVSTEIASVGLNYEQHESCILFGDGAAAAVIGKSRSCDSSRIISSRMETYSNGAHLTEIRGGGTRFHPRGHTEETKNEFLFDMDGRAVFKLSYELITGFVDRLFDKTDLEISDIHVVIPHQASHTAMKIIRSLLKIPEERFMSIIHDHGNTIAASIPLALYEAIRQNKMHRGDKALMIGTSAGLSIGGIIFEY